MKKRILLSLLFVAITAQANISADTAQGGVKSATSVIAKIPSAFCAFITQASHKVASAKNCVVGLAQSVVTGAQNKASLIANSTALAPVRSVVSKGYSKGVETYEQHPTAVKITAGTAAVVAASYIAYKKLCPYAKRSGTCPQHKKA